MGEPTLVRPGSPFGTHPRLSIVSCVCRPAAGVDISFREAQATWTDLAPFADRRALQSAERLGLGSDAKSLSRLVTTAELPVLVSALVRANLAKTHDEILETAR
jgi:hypothetical protein